MGLMVMPVTDERPGHCGRVLLPRPPPRTQQCETIENIRRPAMQHSKSIYKRHRTRVPSYSLNGDPSPDYTMARHRKDLDHVRYGGRSRRGKTLRLPQTDRVTQQTAEGIITPHIARFAAKCFSGSNPQAHTSHDGTVPMESGQI